ncbi:hypothetical protein CLOP_g9634 [Closterium sp. NIES-67]|nr:hypothetical protein CLOP_g9634 [Closterium sp. NIES-67]
MAAERIVTERVKGVRDELLSRMGVLKGQVLQAAQREARHAVSELKAETKTEMKTEMADMIGAEMREVKEDVEHLQEDMEELEEKRGALAERIGRLEAAVEGGIDAGEKAARRQAESVRAATTEAEKRLVAVIGKVTVSVARCNAAIQQWRNERRSERNGGGRAEGEQCAGSEQSEKRKRRRKEAGDAGDVTSDVASRDGALLGCTCDLAGTDWKAMEGGEGEEPVQDVRNAVTAGAMREAAERRDMESQVRALREEVQAMQGRVAHLEEMSGEGEKIWEVLVRVWSRAVPQDSYLPLTSISFITDSVLSQLASSHHLTAISLKGSTGFTAAGIQGLHSLPRLSWLSLEDTHTMDAALGSITRLATLTNLVLSNTDITDAGIAQLQGLSALQALRISGCASVTSAGMVHVGALTALECLTLHSSGVREEGLQHLTGLTSLKLLTLPPRVTDSGLRHLRNMQQLEKLGLWNAVITAEGVRWLRRLHRLEDVAAPGVDDVVLGWIRGILPRVKLVTVLGYWNQQHASRN